jgi:hypothetical protein
LKGTGVLVLSEDTEMEIPTGRFERNFNGDGQGTYERRFRVGNNQSVCYGSATHLKLKSNGIGSM